MFYFYGQASSHLNWNQNIGTQALLGIKCRLEEKMYFKSLQSELGRLGCIIEPYGLKTNWHFQYLLSF